MVVKHNSLSVTAFRDNCWSEIESSELIPGDRIKGQVHIATYVHKFTCMSIHWLNMVYSMRRYNCSCWLYSVGWESDRRRMLTGESMPVTKMPLKSSSGIYSRESNKDSTLYGGTKIIQGRVRKQDWPISSSPVFFPTIFQAWSRLLSGRRQLSTRRDLTRAAGLWSAPSSIRNRTTSSFSEMGLL